MKVYPLAIEDVADRQTFWPAWDDRWTDGRGETHAEYVHRHIIASAMRYVAEDPETGAALPMMEVKDIDPADRVSLTLPYAGGGSLRITHFLLRSESWIPQFFLYRVTDIGTHTLTAPAHRYELDLDVMGTVTLQHPPSFAFSIRGNWDSFTHSLGERYQPYGSPMEVVRPWCIELPHPDDVQAVVTIGSTPRVTDFAPVFVTVSGVTTTGNFASYFAVCALTKGTSLYFPGQLGPLGFSQAQGRGLIYPSLEELINNPTAYTPFTASDRIVSMSISRRSPIGRIRIEKREEYGGQFLGVTFLDKQPRAVSVEHGSRVMTEIDLGAYHIEEIGETPDISSVMWPSVSLEVHDMMLNLVGDMDPRLFVPFASGDEGYVANVKVSGLRLMTSNSITGVESKLLLPDGSAIKWNEGSLAYNTSAYLDYLAVQQRYDREMLSIANQRAFTNMAVSGAKSIANGVLTGALSSGPAGIATGALGVIGDVAQYAAERRFAREELEAKVDQTKQVPDNVYTSSTDQWLANATALANSEDVLADMIVLRLPKEFFIVEDGTVVKTNFVNDMIRLGVYAGKRYAKLSNDFPWYNSNVRYVKANTIDFVQMMTWATARYHAQPGYIEARVRRTLIDGVWLYRLPEYEVNE